jgi:uncharacterized protein YkwD
MRSPLSAVEFRILKLVNHQRALIGQPPLAFSPRLMMTARTHSEDMAAHHYLGYDGPGGDTPADRAHASGVGYLELAETVYSAGAGGLETLPARTVAAWLASSAYRAKLLSPQLRASAVGVARAADGSFYVTEDFIR